MTITYAPEPGDVPMWKVVEVTDGHRSTRWHVRLWTGQVLRFTRRKEAEAAYWR
jgi:hypothetical protein